MSLVSSFFGTRCSPKPIHLIVIVDILMGWIIVPALCRDLWLRTLESGNSVNSCRARVIYFALCILHFTATYCFYPISFVSVVHIRLTCAIKHFLLTDLLTVDLLMLRSEWLIGHFGDVFPSQSFGFVLKKGKEEYLYSAFHILCISQSAQAWITQFYLQIHHACLSFVSVHQMAPSLTEVRGIQLQLTTHLSTPKGWKAELAWLVGL